MQINDPYSTVWTEVDETPTLSREQLEALAWAQQGKTANEIGQILGLSGRGVEKRFARIFEVLGVRSRVQAIIRARELGLLRPPAEPETPNRSFKPAESTSTRGRSGS